MVGFRYRSFGLPVALLSLLLVGVGAFEAQPRSRTPIDPRIPTATAAGEDSKVAEINNWTVGVAGGFFEGTFIRFAVELGKVLDDGENLRVLPIVSYGGNENVNDLLYLKGVDLAIAYTDTLDFYKKSGQVKNIEQRINYISELLVAELYVYARPEIQSLKDLEGKKVSLGTKGGSTTTTAPIVFERMGVHPDIVYVNNTVTIEMMKKGEIDAIVTSGGKPNDLFVKLKPEPGFHFIPIEYGPKFTDYYVPCPLTHSDYPQLIPDGQTVQTLCMQAVLAVYNFPKGSDRARRVGRFIDYYFDRFEKLKQPSFHPKWKDVNLAAKVPGWNRYWQASDKLAATATAAMTGTTTVHREPVDREKLFQDYMAWQREQRKTQ
jgi:ABC-type amino acid transport substrate-binding protein